MKFHKVVFCGLLAAFFWGCRADNPRVLFQTDLGDIEVEIFEKSSPVTAANFLRYVDQGLYDGAAFYRVVTLDNQPDNDVKIEVIQGGLRSEDEKENFGPIEHETTQETGVLHVDGVISMARSQPGTASSEFFFCINDQPELDFAGKRNPDGQGFAAFGRVTRGMEVVRNIQQQPADGQMLIERVVINRISRVR